MADQLLDPIRDVLEGQIDFAGQRKAEFLSNFLLISFATVGFIAGYAAQNIYYPLYIGLAGTGLAFVAIVPPWPFFNKDPVQWLPPQDAVAIDVEVDGKKVS